MISMILYYAFIRDQIACNNVQHTPCGRVDTSKTVIILYDEFNTTVIIIIYT